MSRYRSESRRYSLYPESTKTSLKASFFLDSESGLLTYSLIVYLNTDRKKLEDLTFSSKDKAWKNKCTWQPATVKVYPHTIEKLLTDLKNEMMEQFMKSTDYVDFFLILRDKAGTLESTCSAAKLRVHGVSDYLDAYFKDLQFRILSEGLPERTSIAWIPFQP